MTDIDVARRALAALGVTTAAEMPEADVLKALSTVIGALATFSSSLCTAIASIGVKPGDRIREPSLEGMVALFRAFAEVFDREAGAAEVEAIVAALAAGVRA